MGQENTGEIQIKVLTDPPPNGPQGNGNIGTPYPLRPRGPLRPPIRTPDTDPATKASAKGPVNRTARAKRARPGWTKALERILHEVAARLRTEFAQQIAQDADARTFKKLCVRMLKQSLPPGPGRPSGDSITQATQLRAEGMAWKDIYPRCIPRHARLTPAERRQAEANLRSARRSRENARAKKTTAVIIGGNIAPPEISA
jgi:hypothetical protein